MESQPLLGQRSDDDIKEIVEEAVSELEEESEASFNGFVAGIFFLLTAAALLIAPLAIDAGAKHPTLNNPNLHNTGNNNLKLFSDDSDVFANNLQYTGDAELDSQFAITPNLGYLDDMELAWDEIEEVEYVVYDFSDTAYLPRVPPQPNALLDRYLAIVNS